MRIIKTSHHQRENQRGLGGLDDPERRQGAHLDQSEDVDLEERDVSEVEIVGLVLGWHQHQEQSVYELHPVQGVDAHVHEDAVQDGHGDELEDGGKLDGEPGEEEDTDAGDSLLPDPLKLWSISWSRGLTVHLETVHVSQTEDGGGYTPGQPQQGAESDHQAHHQHVQVIAAPLLQLVLLPVDDDGGDLLVHEEEDGEEEGGDGGEEVDIPWR